METIKITKSDLDKDNYYKKDCIGTWNEYEDVNVEIDEYLGWVKFKKGIYVNGQITAKAGSGIEAGWGIEAGSGIKAGWGIEAGSGIKAGSGIEAGWGIEAGSGIKAGSGIEAGSGIKAGSGIEAGWGIKAGSGITSLYSWIKAKLTINFNSSCTISAGIFSTFGEQEIEAQEIKGGKIIYGKVNLLPKPETPKLSLSGKEVKVTVDGQEFIAVIK